MLAEYGHLVDTDEVDCEIDTTMSNWQQFGCFSRKYLATLSSLTLIALVWTLYYRLSVRKYNK